MLSLIDCGVKELRDSAIVSDDMMRAIQLWEQMYRGEVPWRDTERHQWMNLPCKIAQEIATKVTNEAEIKIQPTKESTAADGLEIGTEGEQPTAGQSQPENGKEAPAKNLERWEYINKAFEPVRKKLAIYAEYACAFGGICFKPYLNGKNEIAIGIYNASMFYPTEYSAGQEILSGFFLDQKKQGKDWYCRVEKHEWDGKDKYTVANTCYKSATKDSIGKECPLTEVNGWENIEPSVTMRGVKHTLFSYFGIPLGNTIDQKSPLGVSVYSRAADHTRDADEQYQSLKWEYEGGEMAVDISDDALGIDEDGEMMVPKHNERLYRRNGIPVTAGSGELIKTFSPTLRDTSYANGLQTILRIIEDDAQLAHGTFSDPEKETKTATEIRASKTRTYDLVSKIQTALGDSLHALAHAVDAMISLYKLCPEGDWSFCAYWDDSIIEDSDSERMNDREDVSSGLMMEWEYRVKWYGETEEQAKKVLSEKNKQDDNAIMGFGNTEPAANAGEGGQK